MRKVVLGSLLLCAASTVLGQGYVVTPIAQGDGFGLNENGAVTGRGTFNGLYGGFIWRPTTPNSSAGALQLLSLLKGHTSTWANGINIHNDVVGSTADNIKLRQALMWAAGSGKAVDIGTGNRNHTEAMGINDFQDVVLWAPGASSSIVLSQISGKNRKTFGIGLGYPVGINNRGQILASTGFNGAPGFIWTPNQTRGTVGSSTPLPEGSKAYDLNEMGQVCGSMTTVVSGQVSTRPMIYMPSASNGMAAGFNTIVLGSQSFQPTTNTYWQNGVAYAMNDRGTVVGLMQSAPARGVPSVQAAFIWDASMGMRELTIPGWTISGITAINNAGQILATGLSPTEQNPMILLLTPQ